jgi:hypothetical protein
MSKRSTKAEMAQFYDDIVATVEASKEDLTVRRIFYLLVGQRVIDKTEQEYERVQKALVALRDEGRVSRDKIIDESRDIDEPPMWEDPQHFLDSVIPQYRSDPWRNAKKLVLVFSEKVGMGPVLRSVTYPWGVPLFPTMGYSGHSFLWRAAKRIRAGRKQTVVLQVGDHDSSGLQMVHAAERKLRELVVNVPIEFKRVAVLPEHIATYGLLTRPPKASDKRKGFEVDEAVEIDAMEPDTVRTLLRRALRPYMPDRRLADHASDDQEVQAALVRWAARFRR